MSRALVVFESMFGNTAEVARAVARGLDDHVPTEVVEVGAAPARLADDVDLVVVGGPTHAFGLSRPSTRQEAYERRQHPPVSPGIGVREWLALLDGVTGRRTAAFGTRMGASGLPGSAARGVHRRAWFHHHHATPGVVRRSTCPVVVPPLPLHRDPGEGPAVTTAASSAG